MTHLAEVHITDGLERYADDTYMRSLLVQSQLENAAAALSIVKSMAQTKLPQPDDENDENNQETSEFVQRADSLVSQIRSAKVITSKAIHQLSELRSRSLTLAPSTLHVFEATQSLTSSLASTTRTSGLSLFALINEEGRTTPFTHSEIITAIGPGDSTPLSTLASSIQTTTTQVQTLNNLTTTLSQTIEFTSPPPPPPWLTLAQNLRAASTHSASHESEVSRLKDELAEKNTALAMREKVVEEMGVKVEVLDKRASEASGRRERVRELETAVDRSNASEKELTKKLNRLEEELTALQTERQTWKKQSAHPLSPTTPSGKPPASPGDSSASSSQIPALQAEIHALRACIRHLRASTRLLLYPPSSSSFSSSPLALDATWLQKPLIPAPSPYETRQKMLQAEGRDALKELLALVTREGNGVVKLRDRRVVGVGGDGARDGKVRSAEDGNDRREGKGDGKAEKGETGKGRLGWRPLRETSRWKVGRQREEWEGWREWVRDVGERSRDDGRERERKMGVRGEGKGDVLARVQVQTRLPGWEGVEAWDSGKERGNGGDVGIVTTAGEWDAFVGAVGIVQ